MVRKSYADVSRRFLHFPGCERQENVKNGEIHPRTTFVPCIPAEQCDGECGGQRHVGRSGTRKSNDGGATSCDESAVEFTSGAETAEEEVDGCDEHGGVEGGGHAGSPVRNAEGTERQHRLPVIQRRLFQPRLALQRRRNPIGAIEHFARHLRVTWLVGAEKTERPEAIEEKKSAERREQQQVGASAWIRSLSHLPLAGARTASFVFRFANDYRPTTNDWLMSSRSKTRASARKVPRAGDPQYATRRRPAVRRANSRWRTCDRRHRNARPRPRHSLLLCCGD